MIEHMFPQLISEIRELEVPVDPAALRSLLRASDLLAAKVAVAVGEFDRARLWDETGATSMRTWLVDEGLVGPEATRLAKLGSRLLGLPALCSAWTTGDLSNGQVQAVAARLTDRNVGLFAEHEAELVRALVGLGVTETIRVMGEWRLRADAVLDPEPAEEPEGTLSLSRTLGGRWQLNGAFDDETGALADTAFKAADSGDLSIPAPVRRCRSFADICRFFLDHHRENLTPRQRPHVALIVDAENLGEGTLADYDVDLHSSVIESYLCDCSISRVVAEKTGKAVSRIIDLGRSTDVVSAAQRTALAARDRGCRYPGCDRPASWTDAHHVWWWERGGPTDLSNLVLLCRRHHRLIHHRGGMSAELLPDATFIVTTPDGTTRTTRPPGALALAA